MKTRYVVVWGRFMCLLSFRVHTELGLLEKGCIVIIHKVNFCFFTYSYVVFFPLKTFFYCSKKTEKSTLTYFKSMFQIIGEIMKNLCGS